MVTSTKEQTKAQAANYSYLKAWLLPCNIAIVILAFVTLFNYAHADMFGAIRMIYFLFASIGIRIILDLFIPSS